MFLAPEVDRWRHVAWLASIYFKDEPAGYAFQLGRDREIEIRLLNKDVAQRIYGYLTQTRKPRFRLIYRPVYIYDEYAVDFNSEILRYAGTYSGKAVTYLPDVTRNTGCAPSEMIVRNQVGVQLRIPVNQFMMKINIDDDLLYTSQHPVVKENQVVKEKPVFGQKYIKRASSKPHITLDAFHIDRLDPEFETSDEMITGRFMYPYHFVTLNLTVLSIRNEYVEQAKAGAQALPARAFLMGYYLDDCECDDFESLDEVEVTVRISDNNLMDEQPGILCSTLEEKVKDNV